MEARIAGFLVTKNIYWKRNAASVNDRKWREILI